MKSYKGFDKDLKCRGFQYEIGKEYETDRAEVCTTGFHACENPIDCFRYYSPAKSRYCEVEQSGNMDTTNDYSKVSSTKIKIGVELSIADLVRASLDFVLSKIKKGRVNRVQGDWSAASVQGYGSAASVQGYWSAASVQGYWSAASVQGYRSAASVQGDGSAASVQGDWSAASVQGDRSAASVQGDWSAASVQGDCSAASVQGYGSAASVQGDWSAASVQGDGSVASVQGYGSAASVQGYGSAASAAKGGNIAVACGYMCKAKASIGSAIVVCERGEWNGKEYPLINIKSAIVDGKNLKADTYYTLKNGEFVEAKNDD